MSSVLPNAAPPAAAAPAPDALGELLARLRYRALEVELLDVALGERRRLPAAPALYHLVSGSVCVATTGDHADASSAGSGACTLMRAGDVVLLPVAREHDVTVVDDARLVSVRLQSEPEPGAFSAAAGHLEPRGVETAVVGLPELIMNCAQRDRPAVLASLLDGMLEEQHAARADAASLAAGLATLVAAAVIRGWAEGRCATGTGGEGWRLAVRDPHIARAVEAIHAEPGTKWSVAELARVANASRSVFAEQFHAAVGEPPLRYVARVRMQRAKQLLRQQGWSVGQTAAALGYCSDVAFSRAFRRVAGASPSAWRSSSPTA
ncbi:helix-turn-helix domain-containing protein [Herbiconiux sp. P17]|uniref:helix-turn-helix domain-containing protein n=1 Tax=Herbiconiux wuyangfengii TaxID=3342794 RepID=UPI0035B70524